MVELAFTFTVPLPTFAVGMFEVAAVPVPDDLLGEEVRIRLDVVQPSALRID
jgi:hypothetical protein